MSGLLSPEALLALKLTWADEGKHWLAEDLFDHIDALQAENEALTRILGEANDQRIKMLAHVTELQAALRGAS